MYKRSPLPDEGKGLLLFPMQNCNKKAGNRNRTGDLRTTNATHYRLCYTSLYLINENQLNLAHEHNKVKLYFHTAQFFIEHFILSNEYKQIHVR